MSRRTAGVPALSQASWSWASIVSAMAGEGAACSASSSVFSDFVAFGWAGWARAEPHSSRNRMVRRIVSVPRRQTRRLRAAGHPVQQLYRVHYRQSASGKLGDAADIAGGDQVGTRIAQMVQLPAAQPVGDLRLQHV